MQSAQNADYDDLRRKYEELGLSYKDKCRRFAQLQELHSKARRKAELGQMEAAASDVVDSSLQLGYCPPDVQFSESTTRRGFYEHRASSPHVGAKHFSVTDRGRGQVPVDVASPVILNEGQAWSKAGLPTGTPANHHKLLRRSTDSPPPRSIAYTTRHPTSGGPSIPSRVHLTRYVRLEPRCACNPWVYRHPNQ